MGLWDSLGSMGNSLMSGLGGLFGGGNTSNTGYAKMGGTTSGGSPFSVNEGGSNPISGFLGSGMGKGLAGLFGSQLVGNPKTPSLPPEFAQLQQQVQSGGSPIQQQSNQYLSTLLSGNNTSANDAATRSLDLQHEEELRQLQGQYKSLRPGSDPLTDSTWLRDKSLLDQKYSQNRADVLAQQQMGAAQQGQQAGQNQFNNQSTLLQPQLEKQLLDWEAQLQKQTQLRNSLMSIFGNQATGGMYGMDKLFKGMFGGQ